MTVKHLRGIRSRNKAGMVSQDCLVLIPGCLVLWKVSFVREAFCDSSIVYGMAYTLFVFTRSFVCDNVKPSFHIIAHDRRIAENTASDRQRLYGNIFQRSCDHQRLYGDTFQRSSAIGSDYMKTLFGDREIISDYMETLFSDRQRLYRNTFRRSWAILRFSDSSDPAIVSDHLETRLYAEMKNAPMY